MSGITKYDYQMLRFYWVTIREAYFLRDDSMAAPVIIAIQNVLGDEPKSLNC
jgi:hypothetical protein